MQQLLFLLSTRLIYRLTRIEHPAALPVIRWFIRRFKVDMQEAVEPDPQAYSSFNAFFTRAIDLQKRPMTDRADAVVSPVDAHVGSLGQIHDDTLMQAKGRSFSLSALLGDQADAQDYAEGSYINLYLSPSDYHRIHMPVSAHLTKMRHIPGTLFSVSPATARKVDHVFARNERVVCFFDSELGKVAAVLVGAVNVAAIDTVWQGRITPVRKRRVTNWTYSSASNLNAGQEMARFNMGSTVILVFENAINWSEELEIGSAVKLRQELGLSL